ncbi:hypothetical protein ABZT49_03860 [Methylobacterium sp. EM32]|uniref:hypothetical protein n=1 Tax=Methylobacterium sp. EM32 TaxID=3163481 RepID=UPI0033AEAD01
MPLRDEVLLDLRSLPANEFVSKRVLDRTPFAFDTLDLFKEWISIFNQAIGVSVDDITLVGSGAVGISLNPDKNYKEFDAQSDMDVAVISQKHFDEAWLFLRDNHHRRYRLTNNRQRLTWESHEKRMIYWGAIEADRLLPLLPFARMWVPASTAASTDAIGNREVKFRIYRDAKALRMYHEKGVRFLQKELEKASNDPTLY